MVGLAGRVLAGGRTQIEPAGGTPDDRDPGLAERLELLRVTQGPGDDDRVDRAQGDGLDGRQRLGPASLSFVHMADDKQPGGPHQDGDVTVQLATCEGRLMLDEVVEHLLPTEPHLDGLRHE